MPAIKSPIEEFAAQVLQTQKNLEYQRYGEFTIQTNQVQMFLALVIILYSGLPDKKYSEHLFERSELGLLVILFQACAPGSKVMHVLLQDLKKYNKLRVKLAHKMWSSKKLTPTECNAAIAVGEDILDSLHTLVKNKNKELGIKWHEGG